jgi:hypothetical protein
MQADDTQTLAGRLSHLERRSLAAVEDADHVRAAVQVTSDKFALLDGEPLSCAAVRRIDAYFMAVLRRRILSSLDPAAGRARRRLVVASIEADLLEAGWTRVSARAEAYRAVGESCVA